MAHEQQANSCNDFIIRCLDIETTGLDPTKDEIVEIAAIDLEPNGSFVHVTETLVKPSAAVPPLASALHHLVDEDLAAAPRIEDVIARFVGAQVYVAHNCAFEQAYLSRYLGVQNWICTYKCALRVWPELQAYGNQALRYQLGLVNPLGMDRAKLIPHRALSDSIVTGAILLELVKHASWQQLAAWTLEPALMTVLGFGKYRGQRFDAVPRAYLRWIAEAPNRLSETAKFSARYWLNQLGGLTAQCTRQRK
jgi:exodeoxyribonuclease X